MHAPQQPLAFQLAEVAADGHLRHTQPVGQLGVVHLPFCGKQVQNVVLAVATGTAIMIPVVYFLLPEWPSNLGLRRYGATPEEADPAPDHRNLVALSLGYIVAGAILVEIVFTWPGIGRAVYSAVLDRDYPMLQGAFLILTLSVVFFNFIADLIYFKLDPRIAE